MVCAIATGVNAHTRSLHEQILIWPESRKCRPKKCENIRTLNWNLSYTLRIKIFYKGNDVKVMKKIKGIQKKEELLD